LPRAADRAGCPAHKVCEECRPGSSSVLPAPPPPHISRVRTRRAQRTGELVYQYSRLSSGVYATAKGTKMFDTQTRGSSRNPRRMRLPRRGRTNRPSWTAGSDHRLEPAWNKRENSMKQDGLAPSFCLACPRRGGISRSRYSMLLLTWAAPGTMLRATR